jgi:predicted transcriptional regulator
MKKQIKRKNQKNAGRKPRNKEISQEEVLKRMGDRLRKIRKEKGYTSYEDFAYSHDISSSQYFSYEKGKNMEIATLMKILKALGTTLKEFFSEEID